MVRDAKADQNFKEPNAFPSATLFLPHLFSRFYCTVGAKQTEHQTLSLSPRSFQVYTVDGINRRATLLPVCTVDTVV